MEKKGEKYAENRKGRGFYQKVLSAKMRPCNCDILLL